MNIRSSMYRIVSFLIIVPFLLFSLLVSYIYATKLETIMAESLHAVANAQISEMTEFCEQQMDSLKMVGGMEVSHAALEGRLGREVLGYLDNILYSYVHADDYLISSAILDRNFHVVACSEDEFEEQADEGIYNLLKDMQGETFYISDVKQSSSGGREYNSVVAISEIKGGDGDVIGYILAEISLDFYKRIRERAVLWSDSTFYLLDGKQQIISAGTPEI